MVKEGKLNGEEKEDEVSLFSAQKVGTVVWLSGIHG